MLITMVITVYFLLYKSGYKRNSTYESYKIHKLLITLVFTFLIHFIIGLISKYFIVLYFPVTYLSQLIINNPSNDIVSLQNNHFNVMTLSYFIMVIPLVLFMVLGFYKGLKKRKIEREKTIAKT